MRTLLGSAAVACGLMLGAAAPAQQPTVGVFGQKYPVSDFNRSIAYYTKYFPLQKGKLYNDTEMALASTEPTSTQRPITLWLDPCAGPGGQAAAARSIEATDTVHRKLATCTSRFRAGSAWLFIMVPDAAKSAALLRADGHEAVLKRVPATGPGYLLFLTEDPDGNIVEAVQAVTR
ncbi:VOC family protein [Sphingomonas solaris]|uniref:VOC family protein n=1 Tax=Alterirhizorhabdus solaris TaxID=2529389 RepID=A0A558R6I6_9SPHN|nr:VOC family protein [Sphingomonas solaris]TVV74993.1 VOC family protein [Sphingomonas solaris]